MEHTIEFSKRFSKEMYNLTAKRVLKELEDMKWSENYNNKNQINVGFGLQEFYLAFDTQKDKSTVDIRLRHEWDDELENFIKLVEYDEFSSFISGISLDQPLEQQANGVYGYRLNQYFTDKLLPSIEKFRVSPFKTHRTYVPCLGDYLEDGINIISLILDKMPNLQELILPNTLSNGFENRDKHPLKKLFVHNIGDDDPDFLEKLADSSCFDKLEHLVYKEWNKELEDLWAIHGNDNTFEDYLYFFERSNLPSLKKIDLRGVKFGIREFEKLKQTKLGRQVKEFDCYSLYTYDDGRSLAFYHLEKGQNHGFHYDYEFV